MGKLDGTEVDCLFGKEEMIVHWWFFRNSGKEGAYLGDNFPFLVHRWAGSKFSSSNVADVVFVSKVTY